MTPETDVKVVYGFWGAVAGAVGAIVIGFMWGGWTTSGTTQKMSEEAVMTSRVAICVAQFMSGPNRPVRIKEFEGMESYQRAEFIEKGGWDKMPGDEKAAWGVANACALGLDERIKGGV